MDSSRVRSWTPIEWFPLPLCLTIPRGRQRVPRVTHGSPCRRCGPWLRVVLQQGACQQSRGPIHGALSPGNEFPWLPPHAGKQRPQSRASQRSPLNGPSRNLGVWQWLGRKGPKQIRSHFGGKRQPDSRWNVSPRPGCSRVSDTATDTTGGGSVW